ncbi:4-hydroxy-tetrahydrodipicolinate synthase [Holzapfeliella sp. He02]|uniref:4-hydroxy-tetrahydrodipicolinate synthase n=1 Tax=Holzapfeliella saturejae TaxID=3082953 RepID=A0ABU8SFW2_9LACO
MLTDATILTAIVTPFDQNEAIDFVALAELTEHLLKNGSEGFVIGGTTGETATLTHDEKIELYQKFSEIVAGRVPIIAGTGSNNTRETLAFTQEVEKIDGIDGALVVVPYYTKPSQRGIKAHFETIANQTTLPIIIYNIPGRTGVYLENEAVIELAQHSNIMGIKQCGPLEDLAELVETLPQFLVYTGEDNQALSAKVLGAQGVISVASHIYGSDMSAMYHALEAGDVELAGTIQRRLLPKMQACFMYPSPTPVKAILNQQGFNVGGCRLPMVALTNDEKETLALKLGFTKDGLTKELPKEMTVID